jgi:hypothetical protein
LYADDRGGVNPARSAEKKYKSGDGFRPSIPLYRERQPPREELTMSLLQVLNLPLPKRLMPKGPAGAAPLGAPPVHAVASGAQAAPPGAHAAPSPGSPDLRAALGDMKAPIEKRRQAALHAVQELDKAAKALEAKAGSASGDAKKQIAAQQTLVATKRAEYQHTLEEATEDLEAIANPGTRREELVKVLARQHVAGSRATETEIESPGLDKKQTPRNHDVTTTTTSYADGKAVVDKVHDQRHVGIGGSTTTHAHETEVRNDKLAVKTADEKTSHLSTTGKYSVETKKNVEVELHDGKKASVEHKDSKEISAKGASHEHVVTQTNFDGSSKTTTNKQEVERGEGKITATASTNVKTTSASGATVQSGATAKAGVIAGKDGLGAQASVEKGKTVTSEGGHQAGVVAGLHANVTCKIGEPSGDPKRWPVTVTVSFGGSVGGSAGTGKKEGSKASVDVHAEATEDRTMVVTHNLTEAELGAYVKALEGASKGSKVAATQEEFRVIEAGAKLGWSAARDLWKKGRITGETVQRTGDSATRAETSGRSAGVNVTVMGVGAGHSESVTDQNATKVTRNEKGALDVEGTTAHTRQSATSGSIGVGVASAQVGVSHTHSTSFGVDITIDPKKDPGGKMLAELQTCKSEAQYEAYIRKYGSRITVTGRLRGKSDASATKTSVGIAGKTVLEFGTDQGVDELTKTDAKGKLVHQTVAGHAGAGGTVAGLASDSERDDAVAEIDGDGEASLTMTRTVNSDHNARARDKRLKKAEEKLHLAKKEGPASGALTSVAGGEEEDNATHDVSGLKLTTADLKKLGGVACRSHESWMGACRRYQENEDWSKAGKAIARAKGAAATVAAEVARFIGGDVSRRQMVEQYIRGGYHQTTGHAFEFPDSLGDIRNDYDVVTDDHLDRKMNAFANHKGDAAAAEECKRLLAVADRLYGRVSGCNEFDNIATKMEMLQELTSSRNMLNAGIKGFGGDLKADTDPKVLADEAERLIKLCNQYFFDQTRLVRELASADAITVSERVDGRKLTKQLEDLQYRWTSDYMRLEQNYAKRKLPPVNMPSLQPDKSLVELYDKKFGR